MITLCISIVLLLAGYFIYGRYVEKIFGINKEKITPAYTYQDNIDYIPMSWGKIFLIQFLNIAGVGPIFGAIMGAIYGPIAFLWIVFGSIFGGAVHDYIAGMISLRNKGMSLPELYGKYMGKAAMLIMRIFTIFLLLLVGAVFISSPAALLAGLTPEYLNKTFWIIIIIVYYILATLLPIDKIIGKIYPIFGAALLFMAAGILFCTFYNDAPVPELTLDTFCNMNPNPKKFPAFPMMFISIACGAISGFHATQSPLMARCMKNESEGRRVFYGAMITEAFVALIWAAAAMSFFGSVGGLQEFLAKNGNEASVVVKEIAHSWLGKTGALLAILGVIAAPISTGDTAFRSARLMVADFLHFDQKKALNRIYITIPLFLIAFVILGNEFDIIWRYFAWSNQTLGAATLWLITIYLRNKKKNYWITLLPAIFMTMVVLTYIFMVPEGLNLSYNLSILISGIIAFICSFFFFKTKVLSSGKTI